MLMLGIGANGHIGFNEPADALVAAHARGRRSTSPRARRTRCGSAATSATVPREALTMGMATILGARAIVLIATGEGEEPTRCAR